MAERKQMTDPLLRKMFERAKASASSSQLQTQRSKSSSHKVVAYPNAEQRRLQQNSSLSTKSSEAALGDSTFGISYPVLKPVSTRPRSLSTGRQRHKRDDLVQSVYDRLGVSRGALMSDTANGTAGTTISNSPQRMGGCSSSHERGRSREKASEPKEKSPPRPRSLSRDGRLRSLWPPASTTVANPSPAQPSFPADFPQVGRSNRVGTAVESESRNANTDNNHSAVTSSSAAPNQSRSSRIFRNSNAASTTSDEDSTLRMVRSPEEAVELLSPKTPYRHLIAGAADKLESESRTLRNSRSSEWRDEKKESDSTVSAETDDGLLRNGPSLKDRMRAFVPEATKTTTATAAASSKKQAEKPKQYPPLIDIYADEKNHETFQAEINRTEDELSLSQRGPARHPNGTGSNKMDMSMDTHTSRAIPVLSNKVASSSSGKSNGNQLANSFLAAITTSPEKSHTSATAMSRTYGRSSAGAIPLVEIPVSDDQGSVTETVSVSVLSSSASDEQLSPTHAHSNRFAMSGHSFHGASNTIGATAAAAAVQPVKRASWIEQRHKRMSSAPAGIATTSATAVTSPTAGASQLQPALPSLRAVASTSTGSSDQQQQQLSAAMNANIERMVDERVKARLFELERRVEEQMRTFLQRMDERIASRIADLERNS